MLVGSRSSFASSKICKVMLVSAAMVATIVPGGGTAFSQSGTGTVTQAPSFIAIDLHPKGFVQSRALGVSGGQQVGYGSLADPSRETPWRDHHALLWRGSAASVIDLHPSAYVSTSEAWGVFDGQQVGWGTIAVPRGRDHALLWRGSAASVVDLHPSGFVDSRADSTSGDHQLGAGRRDGNCIGPPPSYQLLWRGGAASAVDVTQNGNDTSHAATTFGGEHVGDNGGHAMLWRGDGGGSVVDLHLFLPPGFVNSTATAIDSNGDIVGYAGTSQDARQNITHAFLWKRNVNATSVPAVPVDKSTPQSLASPKTLIITSDEAAAFILTDPQGRRTGRDPVHNVAYHDIPGAVYRLDICEWSSTTVLEVPNRAPGRYTLDVFGDGNFTAYVSTWGVSGGWLTHSFEGTATGAASSRFTFPSDVIPFAGVRASLTIYPASDAFEVNGVFTPGPGAAISPATQDVTIEVEGRFVGTIPAGSFRPIGPVYVFKGAIKGVALQTTVTPAGTNSYTFKIEGAKTDKIEGAKAAVPWPWFGGTEAISAASNVKLAIAVGDSAGIIHVNEEFAP